MPSTTLSLLIVGHPTPCPRTSVETFTGAVSKAFKAHGGWFVTTAHPRELILGERFDAALVLVGGAQFHRFREAITGAVKVTASLMEVAYDVDIPFVTLPCNALGQAISVPYPMSAELAASVTPAGPTSLLLDHPWPYKERPENAAWERTLYEALGKIRGELRVAQMEREGRVAFEWVESVPELPYEQYLKATEPYTHFIMTHSGSYNASLVDMVARGKVCMAPKGIGHPAHFADLGLLEVNSSEDLVRTMRATRAPLPRPSCLTPLDEAVHIMDSELRKRL